MTDVDAHERDAFARKALEAAIRVGLVALLVAWCWEIVRPFVTPVAWGIILAIAVYPGFAALRRLLAGHGGWAAIVVTALALVVFLGPVSVLTTTLLENLQTLAAKLGGGTLAVPPPPARVATWPLIGEPLHRLWTLASVNLEAALGEIGPQLQVISSWLLGFVAGLGLGFLQFILAIVIAGFLLAHAVAAQGAAQAFAQRVAGGRGPGFLELGIATIRNVARGVLGTALIQATLAGIGLVAVGIPAAGLLAFLVFLLSALQIGAGLVLIPAMIYVFATADLLTAILFAAWSIPVTLVDNFLKPILMSRGVDVPMLVIFIGVVGGTLASGIIGLFIGPVVLALGYKLLLAWVLGGPEEVLATKARHRPLAMTDGAAGAAPLPPPELLSLFQVDNGWNTFVITARARCFVLPVRRGTPSSGENVMIIDHRTYSLHPGKLNKWVELYEKRGLPVQQRHLGRLIGFFVTEVGPLNQVVFMWAYDDMGDRERRRAAMAKDPDWQDFLARVEQLGALQHQENKLLAPVPFSPIK